MAKGRSPLPSSRNHHSSPRTRHHDSPSRQLHVDLERTFAQLQLFENERQKLHAFNRKSVQDELDAREMAQAIAHRTEIEDAIVKHELVRQQAVAVLEAHIKEERIKRLQQEEAERRQKEEEDRRIRQEERRRIKENIERKAKEEKDNAEAAKRAAAEKAIAEEAQRRQEEREATVEREKQARARAEAEAETTRKQQEAAKVAAVKSVPVSVQAGSVPDNEPSWSTHPEIRHRHYLSIHRNLKAFRKDFWDKAKKDPQLKPFVGEMRRLLKTSIGQLTTDDKRANTLAVSGFPFF
jgi:nucleoporin GLE1